MTPHQTRAFDSINACKPTTALLYSLGAHLQPTVLEDERTVAAVRYEPDSPMDQLLKPWFISDYEDAHSLLCLHADPWQSDWTISLVSKVKSSHSGEHNLTFATVPAEYRWVFFRYPDDPRVILVEAGPLFKVDENHVIKRIAANPNPTVAVPEAGSDKQWTVAISAETETVIGDGVIDFAQQVIDKNPNLVNEVMMVDSYKRAAPPTPESEAAAGPQSAADPDQPPASTYRVIDSLQFRPPVPKT